MNTTSWAHLPNAKHIDRILANLTANLDKWGTVSNAVAFNAAWVAAYTAAQNAIYYAISDAAQNAIYYATRKVAQEAARAAAFTAAWNAILALVAYDDCAYLLNEKPEDVKMLALLGNQKAILLYSACFALQKEKELV